MSDQFDESEELDFLQQTETVGTAEKDKSAGASAADEQSHENDFQTEFKFLKVDGVERKNDRYVWFCGDMMTDQQKRSRPDFAIGGEYFGQDFPALSISKYFLYRARITPITLQPRQEARDNRITNDEVERFEGQIQITGTAAAPERLQHIKAYPGDQLETIVYGGRTGGGKGVIELTELAGREYALAETRKLVNDLQLKIFPNWISILRGEEFLPVTLRGLELLIHEAVDKHPDDRLLQSVANQMLNESCMQFRAYGTAYLEREAVRIRAGVNPNGGYVHNYNPTAVVLMRQLEIKRESLVEMRSEHPAQTGAARPADDNRAADAMLELAAANRELAAAQRDALKANQTTVNRQMSRKSARSAD